MTFTGIIGKICWFPLNAIIQLCVKLRIHPNILTLVGVLINVAAGIALAVDQAHVLSGQVAQIADALGIASGHHQALGARRQAYEFVLARLEIAAEQRRRRLRREKDWTQLELADRVHAAGLEPAKSETVAVPRVDGARLVLECRALATLDFDPRRFLDPAVDRNYPKKDYHRMYIGEITRCLVKAPR